MMPERSRDWIGVLLALCTLLPLTSLSAAGSVNRSELDSIESQLRESLSGVPPDSGVLIDRERDRVLLREPVSLLFEPDSASLKQDALASVPLSATLRVLKERRLLSAQVAVYTDSIGGASANLSFAKARVKTLCSALREAGISRFRLHQRAAGQTGALASNVTPEGRLQNRRVEIVFQRAAS